jgi:hypothetical protein
MNRDQVGDGVCGEQDAVDGSRNGCGGRNADAAQCQ